MGKTGAGVHGECYAAQDPTTLQPDGAGGIGGPAERAGGNGGPLKCWRTYPTTWRRAHRTSAFFYIPRGVTLLDCSRNYWTLLFELPDFNIRIGDVLVAQGDGPGALAAFRRALQIAEALAARDPANTEWQRDLSVNYNKIGNVLAAQGDGPGALAAYCKALQMAEALAARYAANTQWQADVAGSCARLSTAPQGVLPDERRALLLHGRQLLVDVKNQGRLLPNQDQIAWFNQELSKLLSAA